MKAEEAKNIERDTVRRIKNDIALKHMFREFSDFKSDNPHETFNNWIRIKETELGIK